MGYLDKSGLSYFWNKAKATFHKVAFSGSYNDLSNKPTIPDVSSKVSRTGDYIDTHPEGSGTMIAYYINDLFDLLNVGGTCTATNTTTGKAISTTMSNWFDATPSYGSFSVSAVSDVVVIDVKSPVSYSWGTQFGIGFGATAWRAKDVKFEIGYETANGTVWVERYKVVNSGATVHNFSASGPNQNNSATGNDGQTITGTTSSTWNHIRITLTNFNNTSPRIAGIWSQNYGSKGLANAYVQANRKVNGKKLTADVTLAASDISGFAKVATSGSSNDLGGSALTLVNTDKKRQVFASATSNDTGIVVSDSNSADYSMLFGIGSGHVNRGIYDNTLHKWVIHTDASKVYLNGTEVPSSPKFTDTTALGSMTGTLGAAHGGTGQTTLNAAANSLINSLSTGASTPTDADYYVSQYVSGGTTTTTYHRRPMSALWAYIKGKIDAEGYTKNTGTYSKPSTGIPATDLASAVQTSLGKADTALQSHQDISGKANLSGATFTGATQFNNYLKLNAWSGYGTGTANFWYDGNNKFVEIQTATDLKLAGTKVSKEGHTHSYYTKPSGGIPKTDLASAVQTSLGKADSALQSVPTASASVLGGIKVGTNLSISNGVLSATNTTYGVATTSAAGLMSAADKTKLDGISGGGASARKLTNTTVAASAWVANSGGHANAAYKASITVSGVTANDVAEVIFSREQLASDLYDCYCETAANAVIIYAWDKPGESITIPTIIIM